MTNPFAILLKRIEAKQQTVHPKRIGGYFAAFTITLATMMFCSLPALAQFTDGSGNTYKLANGQIQECGGLTKMCSSLTGPNTVPTQLVATGNGTSSLVLYMLASNNNQPKQVWQYTSSFNWTALTNNANTTVSSIAIGRNLLTMQAYLSGQRSQKWVYTGVPMDWAPEGKCPTHHAVYGLINARYVALGGAFSPIGCPLSDEANTPDGQGRFNNFAQGQIVWSPNQGSSDMVVSAYWQTISNPNQYFVNEVTVNWGDSTPQWDKFLIWPNASNPNNSILTQYEVDNSPPAINGSVIFGQFCASSYSIGVKGCDNANFGGKDKCNPNWTTPVNI